MPNWVYNNLTLKAKSEKRLLEVIQEITSDEDGKMVLDFNKIIPTPSNVFQGPCNESTIKALNAYVNINNLTTDEELNKVLKDPHWEDETPKFEFIDMTKKEFVEKYKDMKYKPKVEIMSWYDWNTACWGTKWNAYTRNIELSGDTAYIEFETAWSAPEDIFKELKKKYPDIVFKWKYWEPMMGWAGSNGYYVDVSEGLTKYVEFLIMNDFIDEPEEIGYTMDEDGDYRCMSEDENEEWEKTRGELND